MTCMINEKKRRKSPWLCTRAYKPKPLEIKPWHDPEFQDFFPTHTPYILLNTQQDLYLAAYPFSYLQSLKTIYIFLID